MKKAVLQTLDAAGFVSCEPLLGPVNLEALWGERSSYRGDTSSGFLDYGPALDWVIAGGESGPHARPMRPDWPRSLRDQCTAAGVPFFFKSWGEWTTDFPNKRDMSHMPMTYQHDTTLYRVGKRAAGDLLDGLQHHEFPEVR